MIHENAFQNVTTYFPLFNKTEVSSDKPPFINYGWEGKI